MSVAIPRGSGKTDYLGHFIKYEIDRGYKMGELMCLDGVVDLPDSAKVTDLSMRTWKDGGFRASQHFPLGEAKPVQSDLKVYLASPFFNEKELHHVSILEDVLRAKGMNVFSPRENQLPEFELGGFEWRTNVFRNDINHIKWCDAVVAIIDDNYGDTGTAWEIGYAYAMGKPVYLYNPSGEIINLMLTDSLHGYFERVAEIIDYDFDTAPAKPYMKEVK